MKIIRIIDGFRVVAHALIHALIMVQFRQLRVNQGVFELDSAEFRIEIIRAALYCATNAPNAQSAPRCSITSARLGIVTHLIRVPHSSQLV